MAHAENLKRNLTKTEQQLKSQYFRDREFIVRALLAYLRGPQAKKVIHRFFYYRCEDEEIEWLLHGKDRPKERKWRTTPMAAPKTVEEYDE